MPNWFVGFPAPSPSLLAGLSGAPAPLAALAVDDLHLTVAFLGAVDTDAALRAWSEASGRRIPPFELTFGEPAWLGHPNHPS
ncbi:MAG: hypothetical protein KC417_08285, partial [Myxococcales bacterium]|nr:hypothetical protein [Myxococcales bacterium]